MANKIYKVTRLNLDDIVANEEARMTIEAMFGDFENANTNCVSKFRTARAAEAEYAIAEAQRELKLSQLLNKVSEFNDQVASELVCIPFRNKEGKLVFEIPFTERDLRNAMRLQKVQMQQAADQAAEGGGFDPTLLESDDDPDDNKNTGHGFAPPSHED